MAFFQVTVENLQGASAMLSSDMFGGAPMSAGAAAGTPVAGAWSQFTDHAEQALRASRETVGGLSRTLSLAGRAYEIADQSAACTLQVK